MMLTTLSVVVVSMSFNFKDTIQIVAESSLSFSAWSAIHESSHAIVMRQLHYKDISVTPYPHMAKEGFFFATTQGFPNRPTTSRQNIYLSMAPWTFDIVSAIALPMLANVSKEKKLLWYPMVIGGLVDLLNSSIGRTQYSDIVSAYPNKQDRAKARIAGVSIVVTSIVAWYMMLD